jgi:hypothetical protein
MSEFIEFPKIARLSRNIVVTEKIDGTNGCIRIGEDGSFEVGSRTQWITPDRDNHGFAAWAYAHITELMQLGPGVHFGEWWGKGIQRKYGLDEKRFSLFNTHRWRVDSMPSCCHVVPVLYQGIFDQKEIDFALLQLQNHGSIAAPGFMKPEGVTIYHTAANIYFKKTIDKDESPKSVQS